MTIAARRLVRSVALPSEHGGWSLTLEPAALGLIVAPGPAGWALGAAALAAFLARTPLKLALVDRRRHRRLPRTVVAEGLAAAEISLVLLLLALAAATATGPFWLPLALAGPLVGAEFWYDIRSRTRRLIPEFAGTIGIGSVAAAIPLAGGEPWIIAAGLWSVVAARSVAAVPFVRLQLRRAKGHPHRLRGSNVAQAFAVGAVTVAWGVEAVPLAGTVAVAVLAAFHLVAARLPPPAVPILGAQQVVLGLGVVLATGLGMLAA